MEADEPTRAIVEYALNADYDSLPQSRIDCVVRNYLDAIGCAAGGSVSPPAHVAFRLASAARGVPNASVFGMAELSLVEFAAFANGCMIRNLDYNDVVLSIFHPSDMAAALTAMAEANHLTGRDLIAALAVSYEVSCALAAAIPLRERGWDQGTLCSLGTAAGLGNLVGLNPEQLANALSMSITPSIPMRVARAGQLSMWKGCATPFAAMTATWAVRMAQAGMTGPSRVFDGVDGFMQLVSGDFSLGRIGSRPGWSSAPERAMHKYFPAEECSQSPITLMFELRKQCDIEQIESLTVRTFELAWHEIGGGQGDAAAKWDPQSRETADHSLPYILAVALVDGNISQESFELGRVRDRSLRPLMDRIVVIPDEEFTIRHSQYEETPVAVDVKLKGGAELHLQALGWPRGHPNNPMSNEELTTKFDSMIARVLRPDLHRELSERLWGLAEADSLDPMCALFRAFAVDAVS